MTKEEIIRLVKKTDLLGIIDSQYYDNELWIFDVMEFAKLVAKRAFTDGFYEGFKASGEGWNGEYPFNDKNLEVRNHASIVEDLDESWNKYISGDKNED